MLIRTGLIGTVCLGVGCWSAALGALDAHAQELRLPSYTPLTEGAESRVYTLFLPLSKPASGRVPVVIMVHGTVGIRRNNAWYRVGLLRAGIGVAEVDFKSGIYHGGWDRPKRGFFQPHAYGVLRALREIRDVDSDRIAIMGFSMGGWVTLIAAFEGSKYEMIGNDAPFAAHVAVYPACRNLVPTRTTGRPVLMIHGTADEFADEWECRNFARWVNDREPGRVRYKAYKGVNHRFDWWPFPSRSNRWWDEKTARDSRQRVIAFLKNAFGMSSKVVARIPTDFERKQKGAAQNPAANDFLTGEQIKKILVDNTFQYERRGGRTSATYLARDGGSFYIAPSGREVKKRWWVEEAGVLCRTVGPRNRERTLCFKVSPGAQADHVSLSRRDGSRLFQAKILKGKQISQ